jgi:hypothetical protein
MVALVDDEDYERLIAGPRWHAAKYRNTWYAMRHVRINGKSVKEFLHRRVMNCPTGKQVDHKNRNGLDCRKSNLRLATPSENGLNGRARKSLSGFRGIKRVNGTHWQPRIIINGKSVARFGSYIDPEEAARVYDNLARRYYGEFACLNFPSDVQK